MFLNKCPYCLMLTPVDPKVSNTICEMCRKNFVYNPKALVRIPDATWFKTRHIPAPKKAPVKCVSTVAEETDISPDKNYRPRRFAKAFPDFSSPTDPVYLKNNYDEEKRKAERLFMSKSTKPPSSNYKYLPAIFLAGVLIFILIDGNISDKKTYQDYLQQQKHEKAEVLRSHGMNGTDDELSQAADAIKEFNEQQKEREEKERQVLGN